MALAVLSIDLEAKLAKLEQGMTQATRIAERNAAAIERRYAKIGDSIRGVAETIAGAFTATMFVNFTKGIVEGLDALVDLRDATGASIENISALEDVAARTGTSFEGVGASLIKLNKVLLEATPGSETANILKAIGLDAEKLKKLDPAQALLEVAQALGNFADNGNKGRIVYQLLGRSTQELGKFLADLGKEQKLVATVTTEQAERAERLNNQFSALAKNTTDAARAIVGDMVPALSKFLEVVLDLKRRGGLFEGMSQELIANFESANLKRIGADLAAVQKQIDELGPSPTRLRVLQQLQEQFDATQKRAMAASEALKKFAALTPAEEAAAKRGGRRPPNEGGGKFLGLDAPDTSGLGKTKTAEIGEAQRMLAGYVEQLDRERDKLSEISEEEKALQTLKAAGKIGEIPQVRALVLGLAAELDQRRDLEAMTRLQTEAKKELAKQREEAERAVNALLESTPTARLDKLLDTEGRLNDRFREGKITADQLREALLLLDKAYDDISPSIEDAAETMSEFSKEAARNIQDALGDTVLRTLKGDFDSIGDLWADLIQRMIAEALAAQLAKALMGDFGSTGKIGGLFGDFLGLFGFAKGGAFAGGVQQFAGGGVVNSPHLFKFAGGTGVMGEAGPEAIMPLRRGRDGKLGVSSDGGGMTIINNVAAGVTRSEVLAALQLTAQSLRGEFRQSLRMAGVA